MSSKTDPIDWEGVYWQYMPRLYNFFLYRFTDRAVAEDLTAITIEKAWQHREQYQEERGTILTWLFSIARHTSTDYLRQNHHHLPLEYALNRPDSDVVEDIVGEMLTQQDQLRRLAAMIQELQPRERELIALKFGGGLTNRAIARLTGLSESNVGIILFRLIKHLRENWEPVR